MRPPRSQLLAVCLPLVEQSAELQHPLACMGAICAHCFMRTCVILPWAGESVQFAGVGTCSSIEGPQASFRRLVQLQVWGQSYLFAVFISYLFAV